MMRRRRAQARLRGVWLRRLVIAGAAVLLAIGALAGALATGNGVRSGEVVRERVRSAGIDCSGMSAETLVQELAKLHAQVGAGTVELRVPGVAHSWRPTRGQVGLSIDVEGTRDAVLDVGRQESAFARLASWFAGRKTVEVPVRWKLDKAVAEKYLHSRVARLVRREARDARFVITATGPTVTQESAGVQLDVPGAEVALLHGGGVLGGNPTIDLPTHPLNPRMTAAKAQGISFELARYTTQYHEMGNRRKNVELACRRINGYILGPNEVFSYNGVVGPRDEEAGFRMASVIVRGKVEPGLGGGICQVSSTLYNAALMADLYIVNRSHHAFPVPYVPAGRDATVVYGSLDFRFRNTSGGPIAFVTDGTDGRVVIRVFGTAPLDREVSVERTDVSAWGPEVREVPDPTVAPGKKVVVERGHAGRRVTVWRVVRRGGAVLRREAVSHDVYSSFPRVVAVGPKSPVAPTVPVPGTVVSPPVGTPLGPTPN